MSSNSCLPLIFRPTTIYSCLCCCDQDSFGLLIGEFQLVIALAIFFGITLSVYLSKAMISCILMRGFWCEYEWLIKVHTACYLFVPTLKCLTARHSGNSFVLDDIYDIYIYNIYIYNIYIYIYKYISDQQVQIIRKTESNS
mgnify:FL=1